MAGSFSRATRRLQNNPAGESVIVTNTNCRLRIMYILIFMTEWRIVLMTFSCTEQMNNFVILDIIYSIYHSTKSNRWVVVSDGHLH